MSTRALPRCLSVVALALAFACVTATSSTFAASPLLERGDSARPTSPDAALGVELEDGPIGVFVARIHAGSPADGVLERGDVIREIDQKTVKNAAAALRELRTRRAGPVILRIERAGTMRFVAVDPRAEGGR